MQDENEQEIKGLDSITLLRATEKIARLLHEKAQFPLTRVASKRQKQTPCARAVRDHWIPGVYLDQ